MLGSLVWEADRSHEPIYIWKWQINVLQLLRVLGMPQSKALSLLVTHAWGKNWLFTSKGQLINTWLTQANTLCSTSLWEFTTEPEQKSSWVHVVKAITNNYCGRGDWEAGRVMAGYKTLIQIRWVQTLQRKLLFWEQPLHKTIVWILPCLERQEPALPTKTIGNAEKQSILINPSKFLLGEKHQ